MAGFKVPTFQERADQAQARRDKALKKLAAKKPMDPEEVARRKAKQEERDAAAAEKSAARKAAIAQAKAEKAEKEAAANVPEPTEAELKEARDAKYAARKKRKKG